jgi:hypothetical protein
LIQKTDEIFKKGQNIRTEKNDLWHIQEILFEKWRLWSEHCKEKKLLILIDGLDEGVENKLTEYLPKENFENVLIIYGSRPGGHPDIIDFWPTLPQGHQERELNGLTKEDIRALIYEVGNKYEIERESKWIDTVLERSNGYPLYIKLLCDAIENGSISLNDINALPKEINNYYEAILRRYSKDKYGNALLSSLFTLAAAKDELSISHLRLINQLDYLSQEHVGSTLREILVKIEIGEVDTYQLFHETFQDFLIEKRKLEVEEAEERILDFCGTWEDLEGTYEQRYALQHYASHLIESKKSKRKQELFELLKNKSFIQTQKKVLRQFESTRTLLQLGLIVANEQKNWDDQLETSLCLVDLKYDEANDIDSIFRMVADGEIDLALKRIKSFEGKDEKGLQLKFILYMLCLAELTLFKGKEKSKYKEATKVLFENFEKEVPANTSLLNWNDFFPSYFVFLIACECSELGLDFSVFYRRSLGFYFHSIIEKIKFSKTEYNVLVTIAENFSFGAEKYIILSLFSKKIEKQKKTIESKLILEDTFKNENDNNSLLRILSYLNLENLNIDEILKFYSSINSIFLTDLSFATISLELLFKGDYEKAYLVFQQTRYYSFFSSKKSASFTNLINDLIEFGIYNDEKIDTWEDLENSIENNFLSKIAFKLLKQGMEREALKVIESIKDNIIKSIIYIKISTELYKSKNSKSEELISISIELALKEFREDFKSKAIIIITTELITQNKLSRSSLSFIQGYLCIFCPKRPFA